jgi:DNA repair photolyase
MANKRRKWSMAALVGIARMASQSELLEAKRQVQYFEIPTRSILNRTRPGMPFQWTINPYRGCEFGCKYCYARYTHEYMEMTAEDFEEKIYAKASTAHLLRQELGRIDPADHIAIGTATDPYQPAERRYRRTRAILEVFAKERGRHIGITTKGDLVVQDLELLREISRWNVLAVHLTITTLDEKLARQLEPMAPRPELRLAAVRKLSAAGICVGVFPSPVLPGLTDSEKSLDRVAYAAKQAGAMTFGGSALFLGSAARKVFLPFLEREYPELAPRYRALYDGRVHLGRAYKEALAARLERVRDRYGLASGWIEYRPELWDGQEQGNLFSLQ